MADLAGLWPDVYESRPVNKVLLTVLLATSGGLPEPLGADVRQGIRSLDELLGREPDLVRSVEARLIASSDQIVLSDLPRIRRLTTPKIEHAPAGSFFPFIDYALDQLDLPCSSPSQGHENVAQWLVILTDARHCLQNGWVDRLNAKIKAKSLTVIPVILRGGDARVLSAAMGQHRPPLLLKRGGASRLFAWLGSELRRTINAQPGERVSLDVAGMAEWADLDAEART
jgi:hypothetical protein